MANSPNGPSGGGPLDADQAERLAELFTASWEALPREPEGAENQAAPPPKPPAKAAADERWGSTTAPEAPLANHKKTLVGILPPTPVMPAARAMPAAVAPAGGPVAPAQAPASNPVESPRDASKRTLLGVAPPAAVAPSPSRSSSPPVKVPSHAPPPPPPATSADLAEMAEWEAAGRAQSAPQRTPEPLPASKSSPRSSRPSGVAKAYVPKEDPHTPAVVVDQAAVLEGEAALAAEEARRRVRAEASRAAQTMRARPGELELDFPVKKRSSAWLVLLTTFLVGGGAFYVLWLRPQGLAPTAEPAATTKPAQPEAAIPVVPSPDSLPVDAAPVDSAPVDSAPVDSAQAPVRAGRGGPAAPDPIAEQAAAPVAEAPVRPPARQPVPRRNAAAKKSSDSSPGAANEPQKKPEGQKKNVIVRDAPF